MGAAKISLGRGTTKNDLGRGTIFIIQGMGREGVKKILPQLTLNIGKMKKCKIILFFFCFL